MLSFVTDFADQAVILPVLATVALGLALRRERRAALWWVVAVGGVLGMLGALKLLTYGCGWRLEALAAGQLDVRSPSGHVASASVVAGGLAALALARWRRVELWSAAVALGAGLLIGATRVLLRAHSPSEVLIALPIGVAGALLLAGRTRARPPRRPLGPVLASAALVALLLHGGHVRAESVIQRRAATTLRALLPVCIPP